MASAALYFLKELSNRELAIGIWLLVGIFWGLTNSKIRNSFFQVVKAFFAWKLTLLYLAMLVYVTLIIMVMNSTGIWRVSHLPLTMMWAVFVAFVMLFGFEKASRPDYFRSSLKDNLKAVVILEFIVNLYVFSLWIELLLVPFMVVVAAMLAIADTKPEYGSVKKLLDFIMTLMGLLFVIYAGYMIATDFRKFATLDNPEKFYLPILLSIAFVPFVYLFALYSGYEAFLFGSGFSSKTRIF